MNYRAWNHRCWLVSYMSLDQVLHEFKKSQDWAGLHVADNSCFHYRTRLMLRMLEDSCHRQDSIACFSYCAELYEVWKEELNWNEMLIKRYIGREALWLHRRFLSICWINHFARTSTGDVSCHIDHKIGRHCNFDMFMNNELQLFRSCTTIVDDDFEDYQAQATYSAIYILWLTKQISPRFGFELQKKLRAGELEILLSKVSEKTSVWDFLGVECGSK
ncbi:unnamed protein product [Ilex paraguariensis]|uniref:Uncharacterized protein n=1 Tax=Ilex paraguariensis TaxID=185542 RepID=A0ABC8T0X9_9AQUA